MPCRPPKLITGTTLQLAAVPYLEKLEIINDVQCAGQHSPPPRAHRLLHKCLHGRRSRCLQGRLRGCRWRSWGGYGGGRGGACCQHLLDEGAHQRRYLAAAEAGALQGCCQAGTAGPGLQGMLQAVHVVLDLVEAASLSSQAGAGLAAAEGRHGRRVRAKARPGGRWQQPSSGSARPSGPASASIIHSPSSQHVVAVLRHLAFGSAANRRSSCWIPRVKASKRHHSGQLEVHASITCLSDTQLPMAVYLAQHAGRRGRAASASSPPPPSPAAQFLSASHT